jgi:hypothetical protein
MLLAAFNSAKADIVADYGWPPPGGAAYTETGTDPANPGGVSFSYTGFNSSMYGQLYFGLDQIDMGQLGGGWALSNLTTIGSFGGATETWSGTVNINTLGGLRSTTGVFTATLNNGMTWIDPSSVGIGGTGAPLAVANVSGPFSVTETFTVTGGAAYNTWYNGFDTLNLQSQTDSSGDFWATPAAVRTDPVPGPVVGAGLPGLLAACGGLVALSRRRRRQAA